MKLINNCMVFNKDEVRIPIESMVYMSMEFVKMLSSPTILKKTESDDKVKSKCIQMCKTVQNITKILMEVQKEGAWPKDSAFSPPFDLEFSAHVCSITPEQLLQKFIYCSSKK